MRDWTVRFGIGLLALVPVLVLSMDHPGPGRSWLSVDAGSSQWGQFLLSSLVVWGAGWPVLQRAHDSFRTRRYNLFTLPGAGILAAYVFSLLSLGLSGWWPGAFLHDGEPALFFESAAGITVLALLGPLVEHRVRWWADREADVLGRPAGLVRAAQNSRAPVQALAERTAGVFVPVVALVALFTFLFWLVFGPEPRLVHALMCAVAVLVIASPCAFVWAAPTTVRVAMGVAARHGILIRTATVLETLSHVHTVIFAKTGILTVGRPVVRAVLALGGRTRSGVLATATAVEQGSGHALAAGVCGAVAGPVTPATGVRAEPGAGISGMVKGNEVRVGTREYVEGVIRGEQPWHLRAEQDFQEAGMTVLWVSEGNRVAGLLGLADPVRESAAKVLESLRGLGVDPVMMTGDKPRPAGVVAGRLGIPVVLSEVKPAARADRVRELRERGGGVAMVGDGAEDASALAAADVGVSMGVDAVTVVETAGIALTRNDLNLLPDAVRFGREARRNMRQNLALAGAYNLVAVPVAAGVLYPFTGTLPIPLAAALLMMACNLAIMGNAFRLRSVFRSGAKPQIGNTEAIRKAG